MDISISEKMRWQNVMGLIHMKKDRGSTPDSAYAVLIDSLSMSFHE